MGRCGWWSIIFYCVIFFTLSHLQCIATNNLGKDVALMELRKKGSLTSGSKLEYCILLLNTRFSDKKDTSSIKWIEFSILQALWSCLVYLEWLLQYWSSSQSSICEHILTWHNSIPITSNCFQRTSYLQNQRNVFQ